MLVVLWLVCVCVLVCLWLQVLQKLPVGIDALKQGNMGKLVKQLSKQENQGGKQIDSKLHVHACST